MCGIVYKFCPKFYLTTVRPTMLYETECWMVKNQHESKISVTEIRMLRWTCGKSRHEYMIELEITILESWGSTYRRKDGRNSA